MNKKLLRILGAVLLSLVFVSGCNTDEVDPPPANDNDIIDNDVNNNNDRNGAGDGDMIDDNVNDNDRNRMGDGDVIEDQNTPGEEIIEDADDVRDKDNLDE